MQSLLGSADFQMNRQHPEAGLPVDQQPVLVVTFLAQLTRPVLEQHIQEPITEVKVCV